jgi:HEAT repeat protein
MPQGSPEPLTPDVADRLIAFARACKAATRSVTLYPDGHPAITGALSRLVESATRATMSGPLTITVEPAALTVDGRAPGREDPTVGELAKLLHDHLVGELKLLNGAEPAAWRGFLLLVARPPEEVLAEGGFGRLWGATGGQHLQIREIDYGQVLRERRGGLDATWDTILRHCLEGDAVGLDEDTVKTLLEIAGDPARLGEIASRFDEGTSDSGVRGQAQALIRLLRLMARLVLDADAGQLDSLMSNAASAASRLSPEVMIELLAQRYHAPDGGVDVVGQMVDRMSDQTIAQFVAGSVISERGATGRLAQAFQALVPESERRATLVELAEAEVAKTPLGRGPRFSDLWHRASEMLLSYQDEKFVSAEYARELTTAREQAIDVDRVSDDPPERIAAWMATVTDAEVRRFDLQLLLDLLRIEDDLDKWREVLEPAVAHVDDLMLLGDFESATPLAQAIAAHAGGEGRADRRPFAAAAVDRLAAGQVMSSMVAHLRTVDDEVAELAKMLCHALGGGIIRPLALALAAEERGPAFRRLTDILVSFGSRGQDAVEQLKSSPNPAVRRTAVHLLREFGGNAALTELARLIDDSDPNIQREAIRAIVNIGTGKAFAVLERALAKGNETSREAISGAILASRDERAIPLFGHILKNREYRRTLRTVYEAAIETLGALGGSDAVAALKVALHDGEWWAPFRTSAIRGLAADALAATRAPEALNALEDASVNGTRGVRAAARHALAGLPQRSTSKERA